MDATYVRQALNRLLLNSIRLYEDITLYLAHNITPGYLWSFGIILVILFFIPFMLQLLFSLIGIILGYPNFLVILVVLYIYFISTYSERETIIRELTYVEIDDLVDGVELRRTRFTAPKFQLNIEFGSAVELISWLENTKLSWEQFSMFAWILRHFSRMFVQNLNLAADASNRAAMADVYARMLAQGGTFSPETQRIVIENLFGSRTTSNIADELPASPVEQAVQALKPK